MADKTDELREAGYIGPDEVEKPGDQRVMRYELGLPKAPNLAEPPTEETGEGLVRPADSFKKAARKG